METLILQSYDLTFFNQFTLKPLNFHSTMMIPLLIRNFHANLRVRTKKTDKSMAWSPTFATESDEMRDKSDDFEWIVQKNLSLSVILTALGSEGCDKKHDEDSVFWVVIAEFLEVSLHRLIKNICRSCKLKFRTSFKSWNKILKVKSVQTH